MVGTILLSAQLATAMLVASFHLMYLERDAVRMRQADLGKVATAMREDFTLLEALIKSEGGPIRQAAIVVSELIRGLAEAKAVVERIEYKGPLPDDIERLELDFSELQKIMKPHEPPPPPPPPPPPKHGGIVRIAHFTHFKLETTQAKHLPPQHKCELAKGSIVYVDEKVVRPIRGHFLVTATRRVSEHCKFGVRGQQGYLFTEHVIFERAER